MCEQNIIDKYYDRPVYISLEQTVEEAVCAQMKGKAVPLQAWNGPEGSRKLRFPDFVTTAQEDGKVVSLTHRPPLPPGNPPGTHFCKRLSRPQGHSAIGRIMSMKNSNDTIWDRRSDLPICSTALNHCATAAHVRAQVPKKCSGF